MPLHQTTALSGVIQHVFAHRFTLEADGTVHLADLSPKGAEAFPLKAGLLVDLEGEQRPSEIKVSRIATAGREAVTVEHKKPNHPKADKKGDHGKVGHSACGHGEGEAGDPATVRAAVEAAGWTVTGDLRRKPKHFDVPAQRDGGTPIDLHVAFDGTIKEKPASPKA